MKGWLFLLLTPTKIPDEIKQRVATHLAGARKPILVGHVAVALNCSLREAEYVLLDLVADGQARRLTEQELVAHDMRDGFVSV